MGVMGRLLAVGLVLACAGVIWGVVPVSRGGLDCGSGFIGPDEMSQDINDLRVGFGASDADACDGARSSRRTVAFVLLGAGGLVVVGGWVVAGARTRDEDASV